MTKMQPRPLRASSTAFIRPPSSSSLLHTDTHRIRDLQRYLRDLQGYPVKVVGCSPVCLESNCNTRCMSRVGNQMRGNVQGCLAHKKTPTPLGPP